MATLNTLLNFKSKLKYLHEIKEKIKLKNNSYVQNNELIKQLEELKIAIHSYKQKKNKKDVSKIKK